MENGTPIEIAKNRKRIFDQTASMHFKLSDDYKQKYIIEDAIEIVISVVLCGVTFFDCERYFHLSGEVSTLIIGFTSIFLLAFTLVKQGLNHKQLHEKHQVAGKMYVQAKLNLASKIAEWQSVKVNNSEILEYINNHFTFLNDLPQIPEKQFIRLKHTHQYKVAFSKFIDSHQNDIWLVCRIKFLLKRE